MDNNISKLNIESCLNSLGLLRYNTDFARFADWVAGNPRRGGGVTFGKVELKKSFFTVHSFARYKIVYSYTMKEAACLNLIKREQT